MLFNLLEVAVKATLVALGVQGLVSYLVLAERRTASFIQDRIGPNRCGPWGLLQPIADGIKLMFKEDIVPRNAHRVFFILAPVLTLMPALATLAVVPFGGSLLVSTPEGERVILLQVADVNIGILYVFALSSLGVYGLALGGWASGSKYSLLGGIRSAAQVISYELSLTLSVVAVLLVVGSLRLGDIVMAQGAWPWQWHLFGFAVGEGGTGLAWRLLSIPPMFVAGVVFMVSVFAETNRAPFDMPEAESELVAGYHTEYSSMKFGLFFLAEYANMVTASALVCVLFLGGWLFPGWDSAFLVERPWLQGPLMVATFGAKTLGFLFIMMWMRWTVPRFRYDQLMELGWKRLLPIALACVVLAALVRIGADWT